MKRVLFLLGTVLLTGLFVLSYWQDSNREWTKYQRRFLRSLNKDERRGMRVGIKQLVLSDLQRVDRCVSCHVAIDKPQLALAEEPFAAHPGDYLRWHPPERFGCSVCHWGQGLATEAKAAHGDVGHWEQPLLRGELAQAACRKCHGDLETIRAHAPRLIQGIELYKRHGCAGCHTVHGFGQAVSIDLSDIADKPWLLLDFTFVEGDHTLAQWVYEHFKEPRRITPGFRKEELPPGEEAVYPSFMPDVGLTDEQALALTVYMLSLTEEKLTSRYVIPAPAEALAEPAYATALEQGRAVFEKYGCLGCHGQGGRGGRKNWNALGDEVPALVHVRAYYDQEGLKELIRQGRQPAPRLDPTRPRPPLYMPAWKDKISEGELHDLVEYLFSLHEEVVQESSTETISKRESE